MEPSISATDKAFLIEALHHRQNVDYDKEIAAWILEKPSRFPTFMEYCLCNDARLSQHATRIGKQVAFLNAAIYMPWAPKIIARLRELPHPGSRREMMRIFAESLPGYDPEWEGELAEMAIASLNDPNEPIAVRVHAMRVAERLCKTYPELSGEVVSILEAHLPMGSTGFRNRAQKIIRKLSR